MKIVRQSRLIVDFDREKLEQSLLRFRANKHSVNDKENTIK